MKHSLCASIAISLLMAGCAPQMRAQLAGFDGSVVDPVSQDQFTTECQAKAQVASFGVPQGYGTGGAIARAIEMSAVQQAAFQGCMAEKGIKVTYVPIETASASPSRVAQSAQSNSVGQPPR